MRKALTSVAVLAASAAALVGAGTFAIFNDTAGATGTLQTGTVVLSVGGGGAHSAALPLAPSCTLPFGPSASQKDNLGTANDTDCTTTAVVHNDGSLPFTLFGSTVTDTLVDGTTCWTSTVLSGIDSEDVLDPGDDQPVVVKTANTNDAGLCQAKVDTVVLHLVATESRPSTKPATATGSCTPATSSAVAGAADQSVTCSFTFLAKHSRPAPSAPVAFTYSNTSAAGGATGTTNASGGVSATFALPCASVGTVTQTVTATAGGASAAATATRTCTSPVAALLTRPSDPIYAVPFSNNPFGEGVENAIDGSAGAKYLNFNKVGSGFVVTPSRGQQLTALQLTTANDYPERDPMTMDVFGSTDGSTFTLLYSGVSGLASTFGRFTPGSSIAIDNTASYSQYKVVFTSMRNPGSSRSDSIQIGEASLLGF